MTPTLSAEGRARMGDILKGPHIKRLLIDENSPPLVEIEPLQFHRVYNHYRGGRWCVSSLPA